jgi:glycosyltransferase involved in cell wall biosynthesis
MKPTVSIVILARNEEGTIAKVITETFSVLPTVAGKYEILVNDDASSDSTKKILRRLRKKYLYLRIFRQNHPLGIARGVEFLYAKAHLDYVYILPGDGQYTINDLPKMLIMAGDGYDIVVGKRIKKQYTLDRNIISYLFNSISSVLFGIATFDAGSTKLYRRSILLKFHPVSRGVYNEAERIIRASMAGYKIGSSPAHHFIRSGGIATGAKLTLIWEAVVDMFRLWWQLRIRRVSPVTLR